MTFDIMQSSYDAFWAGTSYTRDIAPTHQHLFGPSPYSPFMGPQTAKEWELTGDILGATEVPGLAQLGDAISLASNVYQGNWGGVALSLAAFVPGGNLGKLAGKVLGKTSGWVKKSIFNTLDPAIQKKVASAIEKGIVAPTGQQGIIKLTASEAAETGYKYKVKILGKGGDIRIYGNEMENGHIVFDKIMRH